MNRLIEKRRSIRKFKDEDIKLEDLNTMVEAGMHAPSALNLRPFEFIIVQNREILDKIADVVHYFSMFKNARAGIIVIGIQHEELPTGYFMQCCGAATQNILLQATDLGLGACWCGVYPREDRVTRLQKILNTTKTPFCAIAVGVPDESPSKKGGFDASKVTYM